ncbi:MAG: phospho-sugar mutase, partial [Christensenellaceae bacterium]
MDFKKTYEVWKNALAGTVYAEELAALSEEDLSDSFYKEMEFGTAGMRGIIGMGINRMNIFTVKRATQALANNINSSGTAQDGVAIAYDTRLKSDVFAKAAAGVLCANGIKVFMYDTPHSVPQLSFTILELHCTAGVVITASH